MKIYRFVPVIDGFAHVRRSIVGRWWPAAIDLGRWMERAHGDAEMWGTPHAHGYRRSPPELPCSDFPILSLQLPVLSERAVAQLGAHPEGGDDALGLAARVHPISIERERFFAVQPLLAVRGEPHAFVPEASAGIALPRGEIVHYHTRMFEPSRLRGEFFTIPAHQPYAETYVTERLVDRARAAGLIGLEQLELVFDDGPIAPRYAPVTEATLDHPTYRQELEWELFRNRGYMESYYDDELEVCFRRAALDGLLPIAGP